jgi:glycosyltransferase involved in cell wall biosynthesis
MDGSLVSIVIPCYNQGHFLKDAIESALCQTHRPCEVIVVDDGSKDHTAEVTGTYANVQYIRQENSGLHAARNAGLRASHGAYLVFLDADDQLLSHHVDVSLHAFNEAPQAAMVWGDFALLNEDDRHVHDCRGVPDHYGALLRKNMIGSPLVAMFKQDIIQNLNGFRPHIKGLEDHDIYLRIAKHHPIHCHHQVVALYRRHAGQMHRDCKLMLTSAIAVLKSQRPSMKGNREYELARRMGILHYQAVFGEPLVWQTVRAAQQGHWQEAIRGLAVLLRCYPRGVLSLLSGKASRWLRKWH